MRSSLFALSIFAPGLLPLLAEGETIDLDAAIADQVEESIDDGKLVGAVTLVALDGEVLHEAAHGLADRRSERAMSTDAIFRIHSCTKAVTSAAALICFDDGHFQFDDPVARWIPEFAETAPADDPITIRQLLTHTSGITYNVGKAMNADDMEEMAERLAAVKLKGEPGAAWTYGASCDVLGCLVEIWSGQSLGEFFQERICMPLGMVDTAFYVPEEKRDRLATLYMGGLGAFVPNRKSGVFGLPVYDERPEVFGGGHGLYSTASDYARFLMMVANGGELDGERLLKEETVALMFSDQMGDEPEGGVGFGPLRWDGFGYTFGFNIVLEESRLFPHSHVGEVGWGGAASCHYWIRPEDELVVVTFEQTMPFNTHLETVLKPIIYGAIPAGE